MKGTRRLYKLPVVVKKSDGSLYFAGRTNYLAARCAEYLVNIPCAHLKVKSSSARTMKMFLNRIGSILEDDLDVSTNAIKHEKDRLLIQLDDAEDPRICSTSVTPYRSGSPSIMIEPWIINVPVETLFEMGARAQQYVAGGVDESDDGVNMVLTEEERKSLAEMESID